ncbi:transcription elongation factor NusA [Porphyromonas crevioricanis]|uniref:transcription termination factor NusA n=1 Tax=Porphyromonas crevioricanis TaxID=393921 RepID=UPI00052C4BFF|nr:transcription termination factor NusA [Porphyromonas crevioricanis]KGN88790.1 transcription elongation factor NusA [Porphyromonas crevioricanis]
MAKKQETISMIDSLAEFKELKNIDKETMIHVLEDSFRNVLSKMFGTDENYDVIINPEKGDFEIYRTRQVVQDGQVQDVNREVGLSEAHTIDPEAEEGDDVTDQIHFEEFGRRAILNLRQALSSKILELQKENFYEGFSQRVGQLISAEVYQVWKREALLLDDDGNELIIPKAEQIPSDFFRKGETVHAVIDRVENDNNNPKVILSRTSGEFLKRLFELNVPEIADGLITIRSVARIPGERAKMAVESYDDRIDPVGACVGMNGSRIRGIVRELRGENIDVTSYTTNKTLFIQRALSPAHVSTINIFEDDKRAEVYLRPDQVPLAIGKNASNIKLASALTGYQIEVFRDVDVVDEEDIYLDEFADEIDTWVLDILKDKGCTTAKSVLRKSREELIHTTDLEEATIDYVLGVLRAEFEEDDEDDLSDLSSEQGLPAEYEESDFSDTMEEEDEIEGTSMKQ